MHWPRFIANAYYAKREPLSIVHFVTDRCNARCPHCFVDVAHPVPEQDLLTLDEIRRLAGTMGNSLYNVNLTGGEPFLRGDLYEITAAYLALPSVRSVVITTNGTIVGAVRSFLERIIRTPFRGSVKLSVSIDHDEERHDELRNVPGAFRKALETYRLAAQCGDDRVMADVALTVTPYNYEDIETVHARLREQGVRNFTPVLMREAGSVSAIAQKDRVVFAYGGLMTQVRRDRSSDRCIPLRHRFSEAVRDVKNEVVQGIVTGNGRDPGLQIPCRAGSLFGVMYPNGDVHTCEVLGTALMGNVRGSGLDLMRLWRGGLATAVRNDLAGRNCSCTYECAWTVNTVAHLPLAPRMAWEAGRRLLWNRNA